MGSSRTKNVTVNMTVSLLSQILNLVLNFVSRTAFIKVLGTDYLGLNGLFTNVLAVLSFAELGIGNAIIFSMYKPLAENDNNRLCSLMSFYKKAYSIICGVIIVFGLLTIPALPYIIKDKPNVSENITFIYLLYLANTVLSYVYVYKKSIIIADQKAYIVNTVTEIVHVVQVLAQIAILIVLHDFVLFLLIQLVCTLSGNIVCSKIANKRYPYILDKPEPLSKVESKSIFTNVKAMAWYKFGSVILNSTSNILVSALVSVASVGLISNYSLLSTACNSILGSITTSFTSSVGNLNAVGTREQKYNVFNKIFLITVWLYGFASLGLIIISKYFIPVWIGEEYVLDGFTVIAFVAGFYVHGVHSVECTYRVTMGYFVKARFAPLASSILNIGLAFAFFRIWGLAGIFLAAPVARVMAIGVADTLVIYRDGFNLSPWRYLFMNICYLLLFTGLYFISDYILSMISADGWMGFLLKTAVFTVVFNGIMLLLFCRSRYFKEIVSSFKGLRKK